MEHPFRLLRSGYGSARFNMGLDQAILEAVSEGRAAPTLRLYAWKPAAVSIGYFQGMDEEVDTAACAERGIDVVRRITGGGAVFHHAEITYSVVIPESHPLVGGTILDSYGRLCSGIVAGLAVLGVDASFAPINDIVSGGRKVSGNAQTRKLGCLLQHGTVLLSVDVDLMFQLLKVPSEKAKGKLIQDVKERVRGLDLLLGRPVSYEEAENALAAGFARALSLDYSGEGRVSEAELARAEALAEERFASRTWNFRR